MAMGCSSSPAIIQFNPVRARVSMKNRVFMLHDSQTPAQKPVSVHIIKYSPTNKVFEEQSRGIVCYRDNRGEIICEGLDEGPRPCLQAPTPAYHPWNINGSSATPKLLSNGRRRWMGFPVLTRL
ncbi:hypothetical protein NE237_030176 [Protea cynaroides]|uniref:Uncharacterized protein n=1 Tax=Protea cynaroides TaxID=273540 RepID=A0A9Q0JUL4_9MAGN|nr:hypothetical protein NE237_030176 [Protea cynaroides]